MPRWGATFDERQSPLLGQGGSSGAALSGWFDKHGTPTTPAVADGPGIPSSTEVGASRGMRT